MKKLFLFIGILAVSCGLSAQTVVSGNITGVWEPDGNPYIVVGDINIVDSLIIEAGVLVQFQAGGWMIQVGGGARFLADGTDESPIIFEPYQGNEPGLWDKIYLSVSGSDDTLKYCIIRNANIGIHTNTCSPYIFNCKISGNYVGVHIYNGSTAYGSIVRLDHCLINDNIEDGILISRYTGSAKANISNCTLYNNSYGIRAANNTTFATITNTSIIGCANYGVMNEINADINAEDMIYSCFWDNGQGNFYNIGIPLGFGYNGIYQNYNEDSCDVNFNIYNDPQFVDATYSNFSLMETSKCIDAGTNIILGEVVYDPDGTMPDMGANYFDQGGVGYFENTELISNKFEINVYPNPFFSKATIEFPNPNHSNYTLSVFSISGNKVFERANIKSDIIEFERGNLPKGIYLAELKGEKVFWGKMAIK
nr:T9SS type A sorting domain-containing protein [Bacteroidota bacterium]